MILFVDACVREESRTRGLAQTLLSRLKGDITALSLSKVEFPPVDESFLRERDRLIGAEEFSHPMFRMARQFAAANQIVIAAPYWDLSFPSLLKQYLEQINVTGITFRYSPEGIPQSLCRAHSIFYITTAGGPIISDAFGFGYVEALARGFYAIPQIRYIKAEGLDIIGADVEGILKKAEDEILELF